MNYQVLLTEMLQGTLMTLRIFFSTLVFALPLGLLVSLGRMSKIKIINWPVRLFILIMRGTPLMLQLLFVFYGLKPLFGIQLDRVLGFNKKQTFFRIILPQVVKRIIPPMGNEFITLVKDTSLAQVIAVVELLKVTNNWVSSAVSMVPFVIAAVFYLVMNGVVTRCFTIAEKRLSYYR